MKLSTQKTILKAVGGVVLAGGLAYGASGLFSGDDNDTQVAANKPAVTHVEPRVEPRITDAPAREPEVVQPTVKRGDTAEEKAQKLADLKAADLAYLANNNFRVSSYLGYGTCDDNGGLSATGWRGIASGISYAVERNGETYQACVSHKGGKPASLSSNYSVAVAPRVEQPPVVMIPEAVFSDEPFTKGTSDANRDQKLADMRLLDAQLLAGKGMTLVRRLNVGEACDADGSILGDTKWKGTASSIQYEARIDNDRLQVCINHKGGEPDGKVTGSGYKFRP
jgi:hypothetical protein